MSVLQDLVELRLPRLDAVEAADRRHRMDRAEIEELELKLERARAEPRSRMPKRFADEGARPGAPHGFQASPGQTLAAPTLGWGRPIV